jgi:2-isopropylmalate synthase
MRKIIIFDTTLRDGEQSPGASLSKIEKLEVARQLERLNVNVIEAGFPISSESDFEAVKLISQEIKKPIICALARAKKEDIDAAYQSVKKARAPRIHVFLATSNIHMKYKLKKAKSEILREAVRSVKYAKSKMDDIEFSPEDASRTEKEFLARVIEAVIDAGARTVNIPDTVGYATPENFGDLIKYLKENVPNIKKTVISAHCHDDLGLATANSLAAIVSGADQIECTINGIGERAGSAPLEEIVMAIKTRKDFYKAETQVKTKQLHKTSRLVSHLMGINVQPNKAIVGKNAFSHEAGIHQDGLLKKRTTYEIINPEDVGILESKLVLGKHSGRHAFRERLKKVGYNLSQIDIEKAFDSFKKLTEKKKEVYDEDLEAIIEGQIFQVPETWKLEFIQTISGTETIPTTTIKLKSKDKTYKSQASGDGPVDACYRAIDKIVKMKGQLLDYSIESLTRGKDALGEVKIKAEFKGKEIIGRGSSTDIVEASALAYLNAINKLIFKFKKS